ncbi:MAG: ribonuclease E/G, partial [Flavobacteriales bacterium]|nr:ribonuclease E/G [Flavobacteriales bacterium]
MKFELVIDSKPTEVVIALLKEGRLIELHREKHDNNYSVGDIYLGKIKKIVPGLNAAFVGVGHEKDGFLHYLDLGSQLNSFKKFTDKTREKKLNTASLKNFRKEKDTLKEGKIQDVVKSGEHLMLQVSKEPISSKGPRLSAELSFAGRYMVMIPFSDRVSISQKIKSSEEKSRLKKLIHSIKPKGFGVIIRTVAEGKKVAELDTDMKNLYKKWQIIFKKLKTANLNERIHGEMNRSSVIL